MLKKSIIKSLEAREILDSRGIPTVEVKVATSQGVFTASVPSGTSTGKYEAFELRDGGKRYGGKGVLKAVDNVNKIIGSAVKGKDAKNQEKLDSIMIDLDGTENKFKLGANAILAVSIAVCRAGAAGYNLPLYKYIAKIRKDSGGITLPKPSLLMIEGGRHAGNKLDFQEFMIMPQASSFTEQLRLGTEIYHNLKIILERKINKDSVNTGLEGGYAVPVLESSEQALGLIIEAIKDSGCKGKIEIVIDAAASSFYSMGKYNFEGKQMEGRELLGFYAGLCKKYPIFLIEDPFNEEDEEGFKRIMEKLGDKIKIGGDDFLSTNPEKIKIAAERKTCNSLTLKPNQIGTVTEAIQASELAKKNNWDVMAAHRSGETCDDFIADFAVGVGADSIKAGAPARGERVAKYNRLLEIEKELLK